MDISHIVAVADHYASMLVTRAGWVVEDCDADTPRGRLAHCRWMCGRIRAMLTQEVVLEADVQKANRWLGFVQGVLWSEGVLTIAEMRDHNREVGNVPGKRSDERQ